MPSEFRTCIDKELNPTTCEGEFEITEGEQEFLAGKKDAAGTAFTLPKRCKPCRIKKKERFTAGKVSPVGTGSSGHHMNFTRPRRGDDQREEYR